MLLPIRRLCSRPARCVPWMECAYAYLHAPQKGLEHGDAAVAHGHHGVRHAQLAVHLLAQELHLHAPHHIPRARSDHTATHQGLHRV